MSDARSLLRQQRTARRITNPHASYSDTSKLSCTLCHESIKTEALWEPHLESNGHRARLKQLQSQQKDKQENQQKRQREDEDDENIARKKTRTLAEEVHTPPTAPRRSSTTPSQGIELQIPSRPATPRDPLPRATSTLKVEIDEDEWAAFEADIQATSYDESATISAPAMTAAEAAAVYKEGEDKDPSKRVTKPELDLVGEREDAQRAFEVEIDEMRELEAKVAKLKQRRDALRMVAKKPGKENVVVESVAEEEDSDEEDDDDWDGFRFRAR